MYKEARGELNLNRGKLRANRSAAVGVNLLNIVWSCIVTSQYPGRSSASQLPKYNCQLLVDYDGSGVPGPSTHALESPRA